MVPGSNHWKCYLKRIIWKLATLSNRFWCIIVCRKLLHSNSLGHVVGFTHVLDTGSESGLSPWILQVDPFSSGHGVLDGGKSWIVLGIPTTSTVRSSFFGDHNNAGSRLFSLSQSRPKWSCSSGSGQGLRSQHWFNLLNLCRVFLCLQLSTNQIKSKVVSKWEMTFLKGVLTRS